MRVIESSLSYRGGTRTLSWLAAAGRNSVVGRFLIALGAALRSAGGESVVFGLAGTRSRPLGRSGHSWVVTAIARPYLWLRGRLATLARGSLESHFRHGAWLSVLGAGLLALGGGRLWLLLGHGVTTESGSGLPLALAELRLVTPALLVVIGALLLAVGPRLLRAVPTSATVRGGRSLGLAVVEGRTTSGAGDAAGADALAASSGSVSAVHSAEARAVGGLHGVVWVGVALALAAGLVIGLTPGTDAMALVALLGALVVLVLVFWRPELMLLAVAAFPWIDWVARNSLGGLGPAWDDALLLISVILIAWAVLILPRRAQLWTVPILLPALLAFAAGIGSVVVRDVPQDVAVFALRVLLQPLLFYLIGFLLPKTRRWVQWTLAVFLLSSVALALHGLFQYVTGAPMPASWVDVRETDIATRAYSVIENPNGLGAFLLIGTLISLSLALAPRLPRIQRWAMALVCLIQLGGVAVTFSRGAWLGLGAGVFALFILAYRRYLAPLVTAGVLVWFVAPSQFTNRLAFAFSSTYIAKSMAAGRLYVWNLALQHIAAHPWFGLGLGTFGGTAAVRFAYGRLWVDNFYLQLAAEGGLILFVLFMWVLLRAAKGLVRAHGQSDDPFLRPLAAGAFGAFIAVAVANATAGVWETLVVGVAFWFMTGLATSAVLHAEAPEGLDAPEAAGDSAPASGLGATPTDGALPTRAARRPTAGRGATAL